MTSASTCTPRLGLWWRQKNSRKNYVKAKEPVVTIDVAAAPEGPLSVRGRSSCSLKMIRGSSATQSHLRRRQRQRFRRLATKSVTSHSHTITTVGAKVSLKNGKDPLQNLDLLLVVAEVSVCHCQVEEGDCHLENGPHHKCFPSIFMARSKTSVTFTESPSVL